MHLIFLFLFFSFSIFAQTIQPDKKPLFKEKEFDKAILKLNLYDYKNNAFYLEIDFSQYEGEEEKNILPKFLFGQDFDFKKYWDKENKEVEYYRVDEFIPVRFVINDKYPLAISSVYSIRDSKKVYLFLYGGHSYELPEEGKVKINLYGSNGNTLLASTNEILIQKGSKEVKAPEVVASNIKGIYLGKPISLFGENLNGVSQIYIMDKNSKEKGLMDEALLQSEEIGISLGSISDLEREILAKTHKSKLSDKLTFSLLGNYHEFLSNNRELSFFERNFGVEIELVLYRNGRISLPFNITLLTNHWKKYAIGFSILIIYLIIVLIGFITRKLFYLPNLLIDTNTNSYSLSALQAFSWTIVLLFSYGYIAFCRAIIIQSGEIPEFPSSLLILMGISYGGLLGVSSIQKLIPQKAHKRKEARLRDLFSVGEGDINLARVQLFGFNLLVLVVYIVNILIIDPLNELPEVPLTLEGLLIGSHAGYMGSKLVNDKVFINLIHPTKLYTQTEGQKLILIGGGFKQGIKVILDGEEPQTANFISPNHIECSLPVIKSKGNRFITIVSVDGSMNEYSSPVEFIDKDEEMQSESKSS